MSQQEQNDKSQHFYRASAADFMKIPGAPIAYWASEELINSFVNGISLRNTAIPRQGLATMDNTLFTRFWFEVSIHKTSIKETLGNTKWFPYNKGGDFRKWYGNQEVVVNWENQGLDIKRLAISRYGSASKRVVNEEHYFKQSITWSKISSGKSSFRFQPSGSIFDVAGMSIFPEIKDIDILLPLLNSKVALKILEVLSPTLNFEAGQVGAIPILSISKNLTESVKALIDISKTDWDDFERSWDFCKLPLVRKAADISLIKNAYKSLLQEFAQRIELMSSLELENNYLFLDAYSLSNQVSPDVEIDEITLTCNPNYRYGENRSKEDYETLQLCDTIVELISYIIGCMMGRYSIDKPGLILASQGETLQDYLNQIPNQRFMPDHDAILPLTDQEWFADDVTNRVREFVKVVWGEETLQENLAFIAESLCLHAIKGKKGESAIETIRRYLSTQFYKDHLKTYKKRPIYWLFSSGKEKAFECLVYLHRYNESTLARMRTEYVTPLMGKYDAQQSLLQEQLNDASPAQQRELEKQLKDLAKKQTELRAFDENLKHYADMRIKLDLDDGVKVNYGKFGNLLVDVKSITGDKE